VLAKATIADRNLLLTRSGMNDTTTLIGANIVNETSKAMRRRYIEDALGIFPWMKIFKGQGIDVGCGPDKLPFEHCVGFDKVDGDANTLASYFTGKQFDYLHASQTLEHMVDPKAALQNWAQVVRPRGYLIFTVPDWVLYEHMRFPSVWNPDHKSTWSMCYKKSNAPIHVHVPTMIREALPKAEVLREMLIDANYNYNIGNKVDQTISETDGVEAFIEVVLRTPALSKAQ
jgi:SAM-dependent methyltransferase